MVPLVEICPPSPGQKANRSRRAEYIALVGSFFLVGLEAIIRILTLALRMLVSFPGRDFANRKKQPLYYPSSIERRDDCLIALHLRL